MAERVLSQEDACSTERRDTERDAHDEGDADPQLRPRFASSELAGGSEPRADGTTLVQQQRLKRSSWPATPSSSKSSSRSPPRLCVRLLKQHAAVSASTSKTPGATFEEGGVLYPFEEKPEPTSSTFTDYNKRMKEYVRRPSRLR
eukprot:CAMPEP_0170162288 /NCGR_PEP_ID=MMETSP0033_2-20121228/77021_1 /TAXON_ID=195969 /ORGANISM="Dolichomastix tenuilepis, Strain CCMP3274" /LENGTH=144 /DNA_ID=CAMNT_0010399911 /DNA_START=481 /DNA_END=915 /DNA_ORIENTATION=-